MSKLDRIFVGKYQFSLENSSDYRTKTEQKKFDSK